MCASQCVARLHVCVYKGLAHPTTLSFATTHKDRCEDWREREPRLWSMASLSKYYSLSLPPIYVCRSRSLIQCLSVSLLVSLYSLFLTVPNTESLFVIQRRKCNRSQICHAFCLISSCLCSYGLTSCAWPQTTSA